MHKDFSWCTSIIKSTTKTNNRARVQNNTMAFEYQGGDAPPITEERVFTEESDESSRSNPILTALKLIAASALFYSAGTSFAETYRHLSHNHHASSTHPHNVANLAPAELGMAAPSNNKYSTSSSSAAARRRLSEVGSISKKNPPGYMKDLFDDLTSRNKLMTETPPEEVKYWFEYTGPLQVSVCNIVDLLRREELMLFWGGAVY